MKRWCLIPTAEDLQRDALAHQARCIAVVIVRCAHHHCGRDADIEERLHGERWVEVVSHSGPHRCRSCGMEWG